MAIEPSKNQNDDDKTYAVKVINKNSCTIKNDSLMNEINALTKLHHPHIVHLKEVINDVEAPLQYLVMQFLPGHSI